MGADPTIHASLDDDVSRLEAELCECARRLRDTEALLSRLQEIAHVGSWELDTVRNRLTWSDEVYRIFGLAPQEFGASYDAFLASVHPDDRAAVDDAFTESLREGRDSYDIDHRIVRRDTGEVRVVHEKCVHVRDAAGVVSRSIGMVQDVTDRRRAEERRIELERQMQHAQKLESLGILAGGIAHDFNNLLMAILGNADLALDQLPDMAPARIHLLQIKSAADRAAEFARQMLAYSGRGRFLIKRIPAAELVRESESRVRAVAGRHLAFRFDLSADAPAFCGDATQVRQALVNLVANASEAIGDRPGEIRISTGARHCDRAVLDGASRLLERPSDQPLPEGTYVFIEVGDTGCGMDAATLERVFDPFFTTKFTGRGLGMSAVLGIVRGHRGAVLVTSAIGEGTTVTMLFPSVSAGPAADVAVAGGAGATCRATGPENRTVLLADDEESVRSIGRRMLERLGYRVVLAADGHEALREFQRRPHEIDAVLLDLAMPHMDGEETLSALHAVDPDLPVALCSGYLGDAAIQRARETGSAIVIQKPYNAATLRDALRELFGRRRPLPPSE